MRFQGKVSNWNDAKGYGFVEPNGGGERAFVHISAFQAHSGRPVNGDVITYELVKEESNRYKAKNIAFTGEAKKHKSHGTGNRSKSLGVVLIGVFAIGILASVYLGRLPLAVAVAYGVLSLITFIAYAMDKSAAQNGRWRTKERTLHLFSLLGGWPGAYFAQRTLSHKSKKREFRVVYWVTVLLNLAGLIWLHTEKGASLLNGVMEPLLNGNL